MTLLGGSCGIPLDSNPDFSACSSDADCVAHAETCRRGFCVDALCEGDATRTCYSGVTSDGGAPILRGVCRAGLRTCVDGVFGPCRGQVLPTIEVCNGLNDDCDDAVDEQAEASCETGQAGQCNIGMPACAGSEVVCRRIEGPRPEMCDNLNNDCDGETDEEADTPCFPGGAAGCVAPSPGSDEFACQGLCRTGLSTCSSGVLGTCLGAMTAQPGDGCTTLGQLALDNDCDGRVDEDCVSCGALASTQSCYTGPVGTTGVGACRSGSQSCVGDGTWTACSATAPTAETCANLSTGDDAVADNDCDGVTDNIAGRGDACAGAGMGRCALGALDCQGGALTCVSPPAIAERCNGVDDDCDGEVDNGFDLLGDEAHCGACERSCAGALTCCSGHCVDTDVDANNCGTCTAATGAGLTCCAGDIADLENDTLNCGECGRSCGDGRSCCSGVCTDTARDALHCGTCEVGCAAGLACCQSSCRAPTSTLCQDCAADCAATGKLCCMGSCVDIDTDAFSCGSCGHACDPGELCCDGGCVPDDVAHCGTCGNACAAGDLCCAGQCAPEDALNCGACGSFCGSGQACCGGSCVGTVTNNAACGGCGDPCGTGTTCTGGVCCSAGLSGCGGACVNTNTHEEHCGACNDVCSGTCVGGLCCLSPVCS